MGVGGLEGQPSAEPPFVRRGDISPWRAGRRAWAEAPGWPPERRERPAMSRSFYVDSLIIKDSAVSRPVPALPEPPPPPPQPPPGQDFLLPLGVPSPLGLRAVATAAAGTACPSRKSGAFCLCPLCVTSHLHASARAGAAAGGGGGGGAAAALPLLKGHFPPVGAAGGGGGEAHYCPRMGHAQQPPAPPQQQQQVAAAAAAAAAAAHALGHPPVCAAAAYSMSDPRRFHCLGLGRIFRRPLACSRTRPLAGEGPRRWEGGREGGQVGAGGRWVCLLLSAVNPHKISAGFQPVPSSPRK